MSERLEVVGIGNAIVDVLARVEEGFLARHEVTKGAMTLIDDAAARALYAAMPPSREISGGSAANTIAGLAALGAKVGYVGRVRDDQLGRIFAHDIRAQGVVYEGPLVPEAAANGAETGRCMVLVTPDGERSMSTYLGVSAALQPEEIDAALMARADWLYLEGYLFDLPAAKAAYARAIAAAKSGGGRVAFTVSDPFCVARHRDDMRAMIAADVDLLFANKAEILALYETEDLDAAAVAAARDVEMAVITLSGEGALVVAGDARTAVPAAPTTLVDTTGAGDLFAAGFLAGLVRGRSPRDCARMGCQAAAEVIAHIGARPEADLRELMAAAGL
ncbi:adenosine kinase [Paralimibaculum aggregatum]|uniref:Adenosine kinase n=1 Tax=Paralimibaculum aggregatum TaxID=3036245 RepID=A0ABQ6LBZ1_9RHOB|nr:adenosine kinase [Limibaculum sp. NKW23]GMG80925.1 adenosine kinase [Limibaculum sp. NKW23]